MFDSVLLDPVVFDSVVLFINRPQQPTGHIALGGTKILFDNIAGRVNLVYSFSSVPHVFWILSFLFWSSMLLLDLKDLNTLYICYALCHPCHQKISRPYKYQNILHTEDTFYEVQTTKFTKTLHQTDTTRPEMNILISSNLFFSAYTIN